MDLIRYTLVTDGSSDRVLLHPIDWLLMRLTRLDFEGEWANPSLLPRGTRADLLQRVTAALENYPCDLLFIHRDAEADPREARVSEIETALRSLTDRPPAVCVVPVRMTEAWLLIDEQALREAAGNPRGGARLDLPAARALESLPDPKETLFDLLRKASALRGRRLRRFRMRQAGHRLAELIEDFSPLEQLPAFRAFRNDLDEVLRQKSWT